MQQFKRWFTLALLVFSIMLFTACGASLQKPTGLEDDVKTESIMEQASDIIGEKNEDGDEDEIEADENISEDAKDPNSDDAVHTAEKEDNVVEKNEKSTSTKSKTESNKKSDKKSATAEKKTNKSTSNASPKKKDQSSSKTKSSKFKSNSQTKKKETNNSQTKPENESKLKQESKPKPESNPDPKPNPKPTTPKKDTVTISIVISSSEVPLSPTKIEIEKGDKVLDVFYKATNGAGIQQSVRGGAGTAYIEGIANVYEFDRGQGSGWMYRINGIFPDRGVGVVPVEDGDRIELLYTMDLGKDLNANLQPFRR